MKVGADVLSNPAFKKEARDNVKKIFSERSSLPVAPARIPVLPPTCTPPPFPPPLFLPHSPLFHRILESLVRIRRCFQIPRRQGPLVLL